jgi:hypothetical protein
MSAVVGTTPAQPLSSKTGADIEQQLGRLVLTLLDAVRQLLERQAERRATAGTLTETEIDPLGTALLRLADKMEDLKQLFSLEGDLGLRLALTDGREIDLVDAIDRIIDKGVALQGDVALAVADIDLIRIGLRLVVGTAGAKPDDGPHTG